MYVCILYICSKSTHALRHSRAISIVSWLYFHLRSRVSEQYIHFHANIRTSVWIGVRAQAQPQEQQMHRCAIFFATWIFECANFALSMVLRIVILFISHTMATTKHIFALDTRPHRVDPEPSPYPSGFFMAYDVDSIDIYAIRSSLRMLVQ